MELNYLILSGSARAASESARVAVLFKELLHEKHVRIIDISDCDIPMILGDPLEAPSPDVLLIKQAAEHADGLIFIVPEWGGMVPPLMKSALLLLTEGEAAHKPVLIVAISAGLGGTYPIIELRSFSAKNSHLLYIPSHIIIRNVTDFLQESSGSFPDISHSQLRIKSSLTELKTYANALKPVRQTLQELRDKYPYGM